MTEIILIVDDNQKMLAGIKMRLEMIGYQALTASDGLAALELLNSFTPHLIVCDVMMPRMNGWELFERVRGAARLQAIPFIFLTARSDEESILRGKGLGAEDYLTKPFKAEELEASIRGRLMRAAQLSRLSKEPAAGPAARELHMGGLIIDLRRRCVSRNGKEIALSPIEFNLLASLGQRAGEVFSIDELARIQYPDGFEAWGAQDTIRVHIKNLRKKIEEDPSRPRYIINVRGFGYRLEASEM